MKITKDTILDIKHNRKGRFTGIALKDFDTKDEWYPIAVRQITPVDGLNTNWENGEEIPCRGSLCKVKPLKD